MYMPTTMTMQTMISCEVFNVHRISTTQNRPRAKARDNNVLITVKAQYILPVVIFVSPYKLFIDLKQSSYPLGNKQIPSVVHSVYLA